MTKQIQVKQVGIDKTETPNTNERLIGTGRDFDRIRRITGYLVGTIDRWNNAKREEECDRVKHKFS